MDHSLTLLFYLAYQRKYYIEIQWMRRIGVLASVDFVHTSCLSSPFSRPYLSLIRNLMTLLNEI